MLVHCRQLIEFLGGRTDKNGKIVRHSNDIEPADSG